MVRNFISLILVTVFLMLILAGCDNKPPAREHFPLIKEKLLALQTAVKDRDTTALDTLISVDMLKLNMNKDSLLSFIYGPDNSFAFERFGDYDIRYTKDKARIDCYLMDSTGTKDRPVTLTFVLEGDDDWLLKRFEAGHP